MPKQSLALYAAVLSTLNLIWNIAIASRDKGKLNVHLQLICQQVSPEGKQSMLRYSMSGGTPGKIEAKSFWVEAEFINVGRRPLTLSDWQLARKVNGDWTSTARTAFDSTVTLKESEAHTVKIVDFESLRAADVLAVGASDSHGRTWYSSEDQMQRLKQRSRSRRTSVVWPASTRSFLYLSDVTVSRA